MANCNGCLKDNVDGFCSACETKMFDRSKVLTQLPFDWDDLSKKIQGYPAGFSISGVQTKGFIGKVKGTGLAPALKENEKSMYIIKPSLSRFNNPSDSPANEHVTMQMAHQIFDIKTAQCAFMTFKNGAPAYVTRRFDYDENGEKLRQEDFASVLQASKDKEGLYKYNTKTYQDLGNALSPLNQIDFIKILIFNFLSGNGDAHLKNFSLLATKDGDMLLSPSYDLMNTKIHTPDSQVALNLFAEMERTANPLATAYNYKITDFIELGKRIGVSDRMLKKIENDFKGTQNKMKAFVDKSFLSENSKKIYRDNINRNFAQLFDL